MPAPVPAAELVLRFPAPDRVEVSYAGTDSGAVSFATPPANGAELRWTGTFAWRCRFEGDVEFSKSFASFYETRRLQFITVKL